MIIIGGCSWSDPHFTSTLEPKYDNNHPKWWNHLNTEKKVKVLGRSGSGIDEMVQILITEVKTNKKVTEVICANSDWLRYTLLGRHMNPQLTYYSRRSQEFVDLMNIKMKNIIHQIDMIKPYMYNEIRWEFIHQHAIDRTLTLLLSLVDVCRAHNVKIHIFQMLQLVHINTEFDVKFMQRFVNHKLANVLEDTGVCHAWPWSDMIGGSSVDDAIKHADPEKTMRISDSDFHPNEKGHKFIGDWVNAHISLD